MPPPTPHPLAELALGSTEKSAKKKMGKSTEYGSKEIWYIPSEKIGQNFWPPWNGFFGINYHYWTWGNAFWPFLAPPDPWGVSGGVWGGQGGSLGPKIVTFLGATFGLQIGKFWIVWTENTLFSRFLAKNGPSGDQKWSFLGWNGWTQKCIFLKNTLFKLPENAP